MTLIIIIDFISFIMIESSYLCIILSFVVRPKGLRPAVCWYCILVSLHHLCYIM